MVLHGLGNRGNNGETDAVVFYDLATGWLEAVPVKGRTNSDTLRAFQQMFGQLDDVNAFSMDTERRYAPPEVVREIYCDKAREFISVCKRVGISVAHSTPGMPRTNAIAESKVKLVLHGARVALRQSCDCQTLAVCLQAFLPRSKHRDARRRMRVFCALWWHPIRRDGVSIRMPCGLLSNAGPKADPSQSER